MLSLLAAPATFEAGTGGGGVLALYVGGYVILVLALAWTLIATKESWRGAESAVVLFDQLTQTRLRWPAVCIILTMAGLPPFFFFGCKLGLLSLLVSLGSWYVGGVAAMLVLFSWAVYFSAVTKLLSPQLSSSAVPLWFSRPTSKAGLVGVTLALVCGVGLFILDDAYLCALWFFIG